MREIAEAEGTDRRRAGSRGTRGGSVLIATSTGVGVVAVISTWLFGIPVVQVGALVDGGGLLFALSRVEFAATNAMSTSVATAYKLLDRAIEQQQG